MTSTISKNISKSKEFLKRAYINNQNFNQSFSLNMHSKILLGKLLKATIDEVKYLIPFEARKSLSKKYQLHKIIIYANKNLA